VSLYRSGRIGSIDKGFHDALIILREIQSPLANQAAEEWNQFTATAKQLDTMIAGSWRIWRMAGLPTRDEINDKRTDVACAADRLADTLDHAAPKLEKAATLQTPPTTTPQTGATEATATVAAEQHSPGPPVLKTPAGDTPQVEVPIGDWSSPMTKNRMATALRLRNVYQLNQMIKLGKSTVQQVKGNRQYWTIRLDMLPTNLRTRIEKA